MKKPSIPTIKEGPNHLTDFLRAKAQSPVDENFIKSILSKKLPKEAEIEVSLFQICGLRCAFCWQDHDDDTGLNSIVDKIEPITQFVQSNPSKVFAVPLMGGELFEDTRTQQHYDDYLTLISRCDEFAKSIGKKMRWILVSNMSFKNPEPVVSFTNKLNEINADWRISSSLDFHGRAVRHSLETTWHKNINIFKNNLATINMVLTGPTIRKFLDPNTDRSYFDYLYQNGYPLSFDYYTPESNAALLVPSDEELLMFFLEVAKTYPEVEPMKDWLNNEFNQMSCMSLNKITILPNNRMVTCRQLAYKPEDFQNTIHYESNANIIQSFITKKECLTCPYFSRCGFSCFVLDDHVYFSRKQKLNECLYKIMFRKIEAQNGLNNQTDRSM
jgi:radical SAM protein with 4Fe4S-binding SPASM domain